jgi:hypothetical protein
MSFVLLVAWQLNGHISKTRSTAASQSFWPNQQRHPSQNESRLPSVDELDCYASAPEQSSRPTRFKPIDYCGSSTMLRHSKVTEIKLSMGNGDCAVHELADWRRELTTYGESRRSRVRQAIINPDQAEAVAAKISTVHLRLILFLNEVVGHAQNHAAEPTVDN